MLTNLFLYNHSFVENVGEAYKCHIVTCTSFKDTIRALYFILTLANPFVELMSLLKISEILRFIEIPHSDIFILKAREGLVWDLNNEP